MYDPLALLRLLLVHLRIGSYS